MLFFVNLCKWGWNDFHGVKTLSIDTKNTSVGDLVEKLKYVLVFGIKYVNLC